MAATMPDPGRSEDRGSLESGRGQTPARRADGPSACPGDSSHERGRVGASDNPWDMQQAEKSIRVRNAGEDLLPRPGSAQRSSALGWATARVPSRKRHAGCPHPNHAGAAGAVKRPVVPHAPTGKGTKRRPASPGAGQTRGDDALSGRSYGVTGGSGGKLSLQPPTHLRDQRCELITLTHLPAASMPRFTLFSN